jgi:hypothetical protein
MINIDTWLPVIPQIIARIHTSRHVHGLLCFLFRFVFSLLRSDVLASGQALISCCSAWV